VIDGRRPHDSLFIGIVITVLGVIFLLDQLEIVHAGYVFQVFWPVILIAVGVRVMLRTDFRARFWGPVLMLIGGFWLLSNLAFIHVSAARLWPLWMIAVGVWLLMNRDRYDEFRRARRYGNATRDWWQHHGRYSDGTPRPPYDAPPGPTTPPSGSAGGGNPGPSATSAGFANQGGGCAGPSGSFVGPGFPPPSESVDDTFDRSVIFMSFNRRITSRHFRSGRVSAVFGGFHLDFTGAEMAGDQAVIQIEAVFGGGEIRIPPTWRVSITAHEIAGAIADETYARPDASAPAKVLIVHGTTVFGGVVIKN